MNFKKFLRYLVLFFCYSNLVLFLVITIIYLFFDTSMIGQIIAIIYPGVAPLLCLIYLISGIIIIRFSFMKNQKGIVVVTGICIFLFIVSILPYISIPFGTSAADNEMRRVYGVAYSNLDTTGMTAFTSIGINRMARDRFQL